MGPKIFRYGKKGKKLGLLDVLKLKDDSNFSFDGDNGNVFSIIIKYTNGEYLTKIFKNGKEYNSLNKEKLKSKLEALIVNEIENLGFKGTDKASAFYGKKFIVDPVKRVEKNFKFSEGFVNNEKELNEYFKTAVDLLYGKVLNTKTRHFDSPKDRNYYETDSILKYLNVLLGMFQEKIKQVKSEDKGQYFSILTDSISNYLGKNDVFGNETVQEKIEEDIDIFFSTIGDNEVYDKYTKIFKTYGLNSKEDVSSEEAIDNLFLPVIDGIKRLRNMKTKEYNKRSFIKNVLDYFVK